MEEDSVHGTFNLGIGGILENISTGKILLLKRNPKIYGDENWDEVGGKMHLNETLEDCLIREILEETGIKDFQTKKIIDAFRYIGEDINYNKMVVITYWCQTDIEEIELSHEHIEYKWIRPELALISDLNPDLKRIIRRYISERALEDS